MATCSSILAWEIPWTEGLGGLRSTGSQRLGHGLVIEQQRWGLAPGRHLVLTAPCLRRCPPKGAVTPDPSAPGVGPEVPVLRGECFLCAGRLAGMV